MNNSNDPMTLSEGNQNIPVRPTQYAEEINNLNVAFNILNEHCGKLAERLSPILRAYDAVESNMKSPPDTIKIGIVNDIMVVRKKIESLADAVRIIISRIEI